MSLYYNQCFVDGFLKDQFSLKWKGIFAALQSGRYTQGDEMLHILMQQNQAASKQKKV